MPHRSVSGLLLILLASVSVAKEPKNAHAPQRSEQIGLHIVAISCHPGLADQREFKCVVPGEGAPRLLTKRQVEYFMAHAQADRSTETTPVPNFFVKSGERCKKQFERTIETDSTIQKATWASIDIRGTSSSDWNSTTLEFEANWIEPSGMTYSLALDRLGFAFVRYATSGLGFDHGIAQSRSRGWSLLVNLGTMTSDCWRAQIDLPLAGNVEFIDRMVSKVLPPKEKGKTVYLLVSPFDPRAAADTDIIAGRIRYHEKADSACTNNRESVANSKAVESEAPAPGKPIELGVGEKRLIGLKKTPSDIVIENSEFLDYSLLTPNLLQLSAGKPGTTIMTMWFRNPKDETKLDSVTYLVRVQPERKKVSRTKIGPGESAAKAGNN